MIEQFQIVPKRFASRTGSESEFHGGEAEVADGSQTDRTGHIDTLISVHAVIGSVAQKSHGRAGASDDQGQRPEQSQPGTNHGVGTLHHPPDVNLKTQDATSRARYKSVLKILRRKQVEQRVGVCRSTLYSWISPSSLQYIPDFPKPIRIGNGAVGWVEEEIEEFIEARIRASRNHGSA